MSSLLNEIQVDLPMESISAFCRRWGISEFALFGSVLTETFGPQSDIDVLVTFSPDAPRTPNREMMRRELEAILGRSVDVTYRRVIEADPNYIIRNAILGSARVLYAA